MIWIRYHQCRKTSQVKAVGAVSAWCLEDYYSFTKQKWEMHGFPLVFHLALEIQANKKKAAALMLNVPVFTNNFQKLVYICSKPLVIAREINEPDSSCENMYVCYLLCRNQKSPTCLYIFILLLGSYTCKMYQEDKLMSCSHSFKTINRVFTLVLEVSVGSCMNQSE